MERWECKAVFVAAMRVHGRASALALVAFLLTGCEQLEGYYSQQMAAHMPTIILPAGTKVRAGGLELVLWGDDVCPDAEGTMSTLFGHAPDAGKRECIAIQKDQQSITVHMASREAGPQTEQWAVKRTGDHTWLTRPDGTPVMQAN